MIHSPDVVIGYADMISRIEARDFVSALHFVTGFMRVFVRECAVASTPGIGCSTMLIMTALIIVQALAVSIPMGLLFRRFFRWWRSRHRT